MSSPGGAHKTTTHCPKNRCEITPGRGADGGIINGMCGTSSENGYVSITDLNNCMASLGNLSWNSKTIGKTGRKEIMSWDTNASLGKINFNKGGLNGGTNKAKPFFDDVCKSFGYNQSILNSSEYGGTQIPDAYTMVQYILSNQKQMTTHLKIEIGQTGYGRVMVLDSRIIQK